MLKRFSIVVFAALVIGASAAQGIVLEHAAGTTELGAPATRVVALEWTYAEDLVAVGVQPVGVADIAGYQTWMDVEPALADGVQDVGTRQEPSLEAILALEPDLIIGVQFRHEPIYSQLSAIAPTLLFNPYPGEDGLSQLLEMEETFRTIAEAVGREGVAAQVLDETYAVFDDARAAIEEAGLVGSEVLLAQAFSVQNAAQIRVFTDNAMAIGILEAIGLVNRWPSEFAQFGFDTVEAEGLAPVEDADAFLYVVQETDDVFANQLAENPIWQNLDFVQEDRAYALGGETWLFGGPLSAQLLAQRVVGVLTE